MIGVILILILGALGQVTIIAAPSAFAWIILWIQLAIQLAILGAVIAGKLS